MIKQKKADNSIIEKMKIDFEDLMAKYRELEKQLKVKNEI